MPEPSTTLYFCRVCSAEIFRKGRTGRPPSRCADCIAQFKRDNARDYDRRVRDGYLRPTHFVCIGCKQVFPRPSDQGQIPRRCPDCWSANETKRAARRSSEKMSELRETFDVEGRWVVCETCNVDIRCATRKGPSPRWCDPCRNARRREIGKSARPWARVGNCITCGGPTSRETGDSRRDLCPKCMAAARDDKGRWLAAIPAARRADAEKYGPKAVRLMGPWNERFTPLEIYRRDRWKCQICFKRVDENLRSPHPRSASLDHVIPQSQDGYDLKANVRLAHRSCNSSRNNRGGNEQLALLG